MTFYQGRGFGRGGRNGQQSGRSYGHGRSNNNNKRSESKKKILKFNPGNSREHETFSKTHEAVKDHIRQKMKDGCVLAEAIEDGKNKDWDSLG